VKINGVTAAILEELWIWWIYLEENGDLKKDH
jgi:hypothetical protein